MVGGALAWDDDGHDSHASRVDALACVHEEPLHVPMKKMSWKPLIEHGACDEVLEEDDTMRLGLSQTSTRIYNYLQHT